MLKPVFSVLLLIMFVCLCRLAPHMANFSPMICLALFAPQFFDKGMSYFLIVVAMFISDMLLSLHSNYTAFGSWTWFTYSALLAIICVGSLVKQLEERFSLSALLILVSSLGFWVWTNLGVWLFSGLYAKDIVGLVQCYVAAIPFLQHSVMSAYLWLLLFFGYQWMRARAVNKFVFQTQ